VPLQAQLEVVLVVMLVLLLMFMGATAPVGAASGPPSARNLRGLYERSRGAFPPCPGAPDEPSGRSGGERRGHHGRAPGLSATVPLPQRASCDVQAALRIPNSLQRSVSARYVRVGTLWRKRTAGCRLNQRARH